MREPGTPEAARLRVVRRLWATRQEAAGPSERWFLVYAAALLIGIYVLPTVYLAGASLDPAAAAVLTGAEALPAASAALGLLAVMAVLLGGVQGPVFLTPLLGHLLLGGDFGRRRVLLRPVAVMLAVTSAGAAAVSAVVGLIILQTGVWGSGRFWLLLAGSACAGLQLGRCSAALGLSRGPRSGAGPDASGRTGGHACRDGDGSEQAAGRCAALQLRRELRRCP